MDLLMACVRMLDILYWVNLTFRDTVDQIEKKEFNNDAVNNNINLGPSIKDWSNRTKVQVRNHQKITHATTFNLCSYHWIMNPHNKSKMLQTYNKIEWLFNSDFFLLRAFWDPSQRNTIYNGHQQYLLEVSRENILEESLQKIVKVKHVEGRDPLKLPLMVRFAGEPGIDEGGPRKEYFALIMKEICS